VGQQPSPTAQAQSMDERLAALKVLVFTSLQSFSC
jgi:hypothetical protein